MAQIDRPQVGKVRFQPGKAVGTGTPKAVDGLIRIADDKQPLPALAPPADQPVLQVVDILEFVHQQMGETAQRAGRTSQRPQKKIVKIQKLPLC